MAEQFSNNGNAVVGTSGITSTATTLPVKYQNNLPATGSFRILVESEIMQVTVGGQASSSWTVVRGTEGTTAAAHAEGTPISQPFTAQAIQDALAAVGAGGNITNPMTAAGDIIVGGTSGSPTTVHVGTPGQVLTVVSGLPAWAASTGGGGASPVGIMITRANSTQMIPSETAPMLTFDTTSYSNGGISFDGIGTITIPVAGWYAIASAVAPSNSDGSPGCAFWISVNGKTVASQQIGASLYDATVTALLYLPVGATVNVYYYSAGNSTTLQSDTTNVFRLSVVMISTLSGGGVSGNLIGTGSTRPVAGTPGRIYYPTNGIEPSIDNGSAWVPLLRPQLPWPPLSSAWINFNTGASGSIVDLPGGGLTAIMTAGGTQPVAYGRPITAGAYSVTIAFRGSIPGVATYSSGMLLIDNVHNLGMTIEDSYGSSGRKLEINQYNSSPWGWTAQPFVQSISQCSDTRWFRIAEASGTRTFQLSVDGINWSSFYSQSTGTYLTPTYAGFWVAGAPSPFETDMVILGWSGA